VKALIRAEAEAVKRDELHRFAAPTKRRAVERTFGRLEKFRRLWKNRERKIHATPHMTVLAFISLLLKRY
jgi:transposase